MAEEAIRVTWAGASSDVGWWAMVEGDSVFGCIDLAFSIVP